MTLDEQRTAVRRLKAVREYEKVARQMDESLRAVRALDEELRKTAPIEELDGTWTAAIEDMSDRAQSWKDQEHVKALGRGELKNVADARLYHVVTSADEGDPTEGLRRTTRDPEGVMYRERLCRSMTAGLRWELLGRAEK